MCTLRITRKGGLYRVLHADSFALLQNVLGEAFGLPLRRFESPAADLTGMDQGLRSQMEGAEALYDQLRREAEQLRFGEIVLLRDTFLTSTVLLRAEGTGEAFYTLGPFREAPLEPADYRRIRKLNALDEGSLERLRFWVQFVPVNVSRSAALAVAKQLLLAAHGVEETGVRERDLAADPLPLPRVVIREDQSDQARRVEQIYDHEERLLACIRAGKEEKALEEARYFLLTNMDQRLEDRLLSQRGLMYSVNTLFRKAAQAAGVHPLLCDRVSRQMARRLSLCGTRQQLTELYFDMIRRYCRLCRENAAAGYSLGVQKILQYIQVNLTQELSAEIIGRAVNFSPGYVCRRFRAEVGMGLREYIARRRVQMACGLLRHSCLTVRQIAAYVGVTDWNYFTKLFKAEMGCTPSEYRLQNRPADAPGL